MVRRMSLAGDTLQPDTLSLLPSSVALTTPAGVQVDTSLFRVMPGPGWILCRSSDIRARYRTDSVDVHFTALPFMLQEETRHKDAGMIQAAGKEVSDPFRYTSPSNPDADLFGLSSLSKSGSISRGIMFGNNQDLTLQSSMDLQMSGKVSDKLNVRAALSDDNIPIQPDGNTATLQDFDQVYIELEGQGSKLIAGDFNLQSPDNYWLKYQKRNQGLGYTGLIIRPDSQQVTITASASVSKGKFARQTVQGQEGNQGPYRLKGAENELYITVLAGTERIYWDGQLLQRGQENDYVINYNLAEVTFTAKHMVTKDTRLVFEFQYSDRNYARSLLTAGANWQGKKSGTFLHFYQEQDARNQPLQQELSAAEKKILADAGDDLASAVVPKTDSVGFSDTEVRYARIDSAGFTNVYVYSIDPAAALYRLSFSFVGEGKGNYRQVKSAANGRVFEWVMPVSGVSQGDYEPVVTLVSPKSKRMAVAGWNGALNNRWNAGVDLAWSDQDLNLFSSKDKSDDQGMAVRATLRHKSAGSDSARWRMEEGIAYEYQHPHFQPIERFRDVEFVRNWNLASGQENKQLHLGGIQWRVYNRQQGFVAYNGQGLLADEGYAGVRQEAATRLLFGRWLASGQTSYLNSRSDSKTSQFFRYNALLERRWKWFKTGGKVEGEQNTWRTSGGDSLLPGAQKWRAWETYISNPDTVKLGYRIFYGRRTDYLPLGTTLNRAFDAAQTGAETTWSPSRWHSLTSSIALRTLTVTDTSLTQIKPDRTVVFRVSDRFQVWKGVVRSTTFLEYGSGLEVRKEFIYLEVPAGQGYYGWTDYNGNGVKELDEFDVAAFPDQARYIRVYTPTNEYVKVYSQQLSQSLLVQPGARQKQEVSKLRRQVDRFADQMSYRLQRKTGDKSLQNPFDYGTEDPDLVTVSAGVRNSLSWNRSGKVGLEWHWLDSYNKSLLINGPEWTRNRGNTLASRWTTSKQVTARLELRDAMKTSSSEYFKNRNFAVNSREAESQLAWQPSLSQRLTGTYIHGNKKNEAESGGEVAVRNEGSLEWTVQSARQGSLTCRLAYISLDYNGVQNTPLGFEMLGGLRSGDNFTWVVGWQRSLSHNMQLDLQYSGRKPDGLRSIHTGSAQIRAFF